MTPMITGAARWTRSRRMYMEPAYRESDGGRRFDAGGGPRIPNEVAFSEAGEGPEGGKSRNSRGSQCSAASHPDFTVRCFRRSESLGRRGCAIPHGTPATDCAEHDENHAHDKGGH